ncbi:MAG: hypothetical protein Q8O18_00930 [Deltaproteobacteria bacterium]|nr:hypothetical protein [Deltaproteobacteria bacterium]
MVERKEKAESLESTLRLERGWENPSPTSENIVTPSGCLCQGGFRAGKAFSLAQASQLFPVK